MTETEKQTLLDEVDNLDREFYALNQERMNANHDYWARMVRIRERQSSILRKIKEG